MKTTKIIYWITTVIFAVFMAFTAVPDVMLVPDAKIERRRREYPGVSIEPIKFSSAELGAESWKFLLGAYGNDSLYVRQLPPRCLAWSVTTSPCLDNPVYLPRHVSLFG